MAETQIGSAKVTILARIRAALADAPKSSPVNRTYHLRDERDPAEILSELAERLRDYKAHVDQVTAEALPSAIATACARYNMQHLVVPADLPAAWIPSSARASRDEPPLTNEELNRSDGVVTGCALAIAQTGTIILNGGAYQGRRVLSLLPDCHVCVVYAEQVVGIVPEGIARLAGEQTRPITFISGPSATSDIELSRVEGVHGPRTLHVILVASR